MSAPADPGLPRGRRLDRTIVSLAVPTLGALVAEPLFLLSDTAMVSRLGAGPLAGLAVASTVVQTIVGLMVFLAYSTTSRVAKRVGAGRPGDALRAGVDGIWLAVGAGLAWAVALWLGAGTMVHWLTDDDAVAAQALAYLSWAAPGMPALLLVLAGTGVVRGFHHPKLTLYVAGAGFAANIALNYLFIHVAGWGVAGSATGTTLAQWGMALVYLGLLRADLLRHSVSRRPGLPGIREAVGQGGWLVLRTLSLRVVIGATVWAVGTQGATALAAHQLAFTLFTTAAFALDALAIAGQTLVGRGLGAGDHAGVRAVVSRLSWWGWGAGAAFALAMFAAHAALPALFTTDRAVQELFSRILVLLAVSQVVSGFVFVADGILIGAGDNKYLALAGIANTVPFVMALVLVFRLVPAGDGRVLAVWGAFAVVYMGARLATLGFRIRSDGWMAASTVK